MSDEAFASWREERERVLASRRAIGIPTYFGSNAWVVAPKKSTSGNPILYGGPMMGFRAPSICSEIHVAAPGLNAGGMTPPSIRITTLSAGPTNCWVSFLRKKFQK